MDSPSLTAPLGAAELLEAFREHRRLLLAGDDPRRFESLLSIAALEGMIADGRIEAAVVKIAFDGRIVAPKLYCDAAGALKPDAVFNLYRQRASIVVHRLEKFVPEMRALADAIQAWLGVRNSINCYYTGSATPALGAHYDGHDVIALQVAGAKLWQSFGSMPQPGGPGGGADVGGRAPHWGGKLAAGDVLYLPRDEIHRVLPVQSPSLHLTIALEVAALAESDRRC